MLIDELRKNLDTEELSQLLDNIDVQAVWKFNPQEQEIISVLLKSDSNMAFDVGAFIVKENRKYAESLLPLLLEIASPLERAWGNRSLGNRGRVLLIAVLRAKNLPWQKSFQSCVIEGLYDTSVELRTDTIWLILERFDEIFPSLLMRIIKTEYESVTQARQALEDEYKSNYTPGYEKEHDPISFVDIILQEKRSIRALLIITIIKDDSLYAAREIEYDEDSYIFDYLKYVDNLFKIGW